MLFGYRSKRQRKIEAMQNHLSTLHNFNATDSIFSGNGKSGLAIDENRLLFCSLAADRDENVYSRIRSVSDIISVEIVASGKSGSEVRSKQIGSAVLGGILFGPAGAIIGGDAAKNKHSSMITHFLFRIKINDIDSPFHEVVLFPANQHTAELSRIEKILRHWQAKLEIMKERAKNSGMQNNFRPISSQSSKLPPLEAKASTSPRLPQSEMQSRPFCTIRAVNVPNSSPMRVDLSPFSIGRASQNDLILQDPTVSRKHALLVFYENTWMLQDQNSTAGCFVNGKRVSQQYLKNGDQITIGSTVFVFNLK